jgi:hypothetical protein
MLSLAHLARSAATAPWPKLSTAGCHQHEHLEVLAELVHHPEPSVQDDPAAGVAGLADLVGLAGPSQRQAAGLQMARALARTTTCCQRPGAGIAGITALRGGVEGAGP